MGIIEEMQKPLTKKELKQLRKQFNWFNKMKRAWRRHKIRKVKKKVSQWN